MKSTSRTSVRRLPSGSYIVSGVRSRSAVTGRFNRAEAEAPVTAAEDPDAFTQAITPVTPANADG